MKPSELQELTLQILRKRYESLQLGQTSESQFRQDFNAGQITNDVAFRAYQLALWAPSQPLRRESPEFAGNRFPDEDATALRSILWQFVGLGMLVPRAIRDDTNQFFELSRYGKQVLQETEESPYDPLGFMMRLRTDAPQLGLGNLYVCPRSP